MKRFSGRLLPLMAMSLLLATFAAPGAAQQPPPAAPGDYFWRLAPRGLPADGRIEQALVLMVDPQQVTQRAGVAGALRYDSETLPNFSRQPNAAEIPILFAAAGYANPGQDVLVARTCRFWIPAGTGEAERVRVAEALGQTLAAGLKGLGIDVGPCERAPAAEAADLIIWQPGQEASLPNVQPDFGGDGFIRPNLEMPGRIPGGTGGGAPIPPGTGDAGLR